MKALIAWLQVQFWRARLRDARKLRAGIERLYALEVEKSKRYVDYCETRLARAEKEEIIARADKSIRRHSYERR